MSASIKLVPVQEAYEDLLRRTLSRISCDLSRLIYLASMRDYNSGVYRHDGLAACFDPVTARKALEIAHRQVFYKLAAFSLEDIAEEIEIYLASSRESAEDFLRAWEKLEPYRIAIPMEVNPTVARLFLSNIKLALAILRFHRRPAPRR